ncbi:MAG: hypothetical protein COB93_12325 [Sneathiella sp.]|nr:MAG: hypothetical protein COB93_12325 [Sneathiella sp.]
MNDGSFGTTANVEPLEDQLVEKIENHEFETVRNIRWRNQDLNFTTIRDLLRALEKSPSIGGMLSPRDTDDHSALKTLSMDEDVRFYSQRSDKVRQLWQVCQVPDFRQTMHDVHVRLLKEIFMHLQGPGGKLPNDWIAGHLNSLKKTDGDIDTLATRIAHTRTWTYISHVSDWVDDYKYWQDTARSIEDKLSDALHERLTQRFVDKRTAMLMRKMKDSGQLEASINETGDVHVEGHFIGSLTGLRFIADTTVNSTEARTLRNVGNKAIAAEITTRAQSLAAATDDAFSLDGNGQILWREVAVAHLAKGDAPLKPRLVLLASEQLNGPAHDAVVKRLNDWVTAQIETRLKPLTMLTELPLVGAARGIAFQVSENMGALPRYKLGEQIRNLDKKDFGRLKFSGLRVGYEHVFMPILLKPDPTVLRCLLWAIFEERQTIPAPPPAGRVSFEVEGNLPWTYYLTAGYAVYDKLAVRIDMLDRLAGLLRRASRGLLETAEKPKPTEKITAATPTESSPDAAETPEAVASSALNEKPAEEAPVEEQAIVEASVAETSAPETEPKNETPVEEQEIVEANVAETSAPETEPKKESPETPEAIEQTKPSEETASDVKTSAEPHAKEAIKSTAKKDGPRNLPFKPTHEMLSLVGTTREQFTLILEKLGYGAKLDGEDLTYQRIPFHKRKRKEKPAPRPRRPDNKAAPKAESRGKSQSKPPYRKPAPRVKEADPDSPFAILKTLGKK